MRALCWQGKNKVDGQTVPDPQILNPKDCTGLSDEQVLFLSDIFPTGYMAAENCSIQPGETVAVWGCGPVGLLAIKSAFMLIRASLSRIGIRLRKRPKRIGCFTTSKIAASRSC